MYIAYMEKANKNTTPDIVIQLGERIKNTIVKNNLRQREVAHDAGLDVENLRKYIKGTQQMKISTLVRIAEALNMTASQLIDGLPKQKD